MSLTSSDLIPDIPKHRFFLNLRDLRKCVQIPVTGSSTLYFSPEGEYKIRGILLATDETSSQLRTNKLLIDLFDDDGDIVDVTEALTAFSVFDFCVSVIIEVSGVYYELPVELAILNSSGPAILITQVAFSGLTQITEPITFEFVQSVDNSTPPAVETPLNNALGVNIDLNMNDDPTAVSFAEFRLNPILTIPE